MATTTHHSFDVARDDKKRIAKGIGIFTGVMIGLAIVFAIVYLLASGVSPTPGPSLEPQDAPRAEVRPGQSARVVD